MTPDNPKDYMQSAEFAITSLFDSIKSFDDTFHPLEQELYESSRLSRAILSGCILTVGHQFVQKFGKVREIKGDLLEGFNKHDVIVKDPLKKACFGKLIYGFPLGLLVYLGRNQHQHHHENEELKKLNRVVRDLFFIYLENWQNDALVLSKKGDKSKLEKYQIGVDPLMLNDTSEVSKFMFSSNIIYTLGWKDFNNFKLDLYDCIK